MARRASLSLALAFLLDAVLSLHPTIRRRPLHRGVLLPSLLRRTFVIARARLTSPPSLLPPSPSLSLSSPTSSPPLLLSPDPPRPARCSSWTSSPQARSRAATASSTSRRTRPSTRTRPTLGPRVRRLLLNLPLLRSLRTSCGRGAARCGGRVEKRERSSPAHGPPAPSSRFSSPSRSTRTSHLEPRTDALPHHIVRAGYFSEISDDGEGGNGSTKLHSASVFRSRPSPAGGSPSEPHADVLVLDPARTVVSALLLSWPYSLDLSPEC